MVQMDIAVFGAYDEVVIIKVGDVGFDFKRIYLVVLKEGGFGRGD